MNLKQSVGIIGTGAMGSALARGLIKSGVAPSQVLISDSHRERVETVASETGAVLCPTNKGLVERSEVVVLAVKPATLGTVLDDLRPTTNKLQLLISIAAGVKVATIESHLDRNIPIVRAMPNNASQVLEGACALCGNLLVEEAQMAVAKAIFQACGTVVQVEEEWLDAVTALSGSGPAYVYLMIEALIDGGVKAGLPRVIAHDLATQTVLGAAKMVIETKRHPAELKDLVATPSGTTIQALALLEQAGFRSALIEAIGVATKRSKELGKPSP
jgi:pyrroline-5-carboxylate reductase